MTDPHVLRRVYPDLTTELDALAPDWGESPNYGPTGILLKTTDDGRYIEIVMQLGSALVSERPKDWTHLDERHRRAWEYLGMTAPEAFAAATHAALAWDGALDTEPEGWVLELMSMRRRLGGDPNREQVARPR